MNYFEGETPKITARNIIKEHMGDNQDEFEININDYIAILNLLSKKKESGRPQEPKIAKELQDQVIIYNYLRDNFGATTGYEALDTLRDGKVDPKIVELWIDEGFVKPNMISESIATGYPEFQSKLRKK